MLLCRLRHSQQACSSMSAGVGGAVGLFPEHCMRLKWLLLSPDPKTVVQLCTQLCHTWHRNCLQLQYELAAALARLLSDSRATCRAACQQNNNKYCEKHIMWLCCVSTTSAEDAVSVCSAAELAALGAWGGQAVWST